MRTGLILRLNLKNQSHFYVKIRVYYSVVHKQNSYIGNQKMYIWGDVYQIVFKCNLETTSVKTISNLSLENQIDKNTTTLQKVPKYT